MLKLNPVQSKGGSARGLLGCKHEHLASRVPPFSAVSLFEDELAFHQCLLFGDPSRHLQECFLGPGPESAPRSALWAILGTCLGVPQRVLFECFLAFFGPKNAKKHSKSTLCCTPRQVPKIAQRELQGALSGPGPKKHSCKWRPGSQLLLFGQEATEDHFRNDHFDF